MRSEPVCREDIEMVSACVREVVVRTDELLDFLESPRLKRCDAVDVAENMLEVSLWSVEPDGVRRLVARRRKLATPEVTEVLERMEGERLTSTWKFDNGRGIAVIVV